MNLHTSVSQLSRVGKTVAKRLEYLGIRNVRDLLYYFPFRYEDYRKLMPVAQLKQGEMVTICGQVELIANKRSHRTRKILTEALVSDKSGAARVIWFNQPFLTKNIHTGDVLFLSGKVQTDMLGPQLVSPMYEKFAGRRHETTHTARLVPIYSVTYGLTQKQIRFLISQIIHLAKEIEEWVPSSILEKEDLIPLSDALKGIHFPKDDIDLKQSTGRLKFDELFLIQIKAELARLEKFTLQAPKVEFKEVEIKNFVAGLPFTLTKSQKISAWEILQDIAKTTPMNRLLSGDVGSGKTVVAAIAMYNAILNGYQAAMMAPTEILGRQHYDSLEELLNGLGVRVGLLTRSQIGKSQITNSKSQTNFKIQFSKTKKEIMKQIKRGEIDVIIGTHALLSEGVGFEKLGLVIVDEQHRFGVEQRKLIKEKGRGAHFLSMTATPIPRSLALMLYGDLDVSIINELPPGRKKILTKLVEPAKRAPAYQFIREQIKKGRQAFVICPLIAEKADEEVNNNNQVTSYPPDSPTAKPWRAGKLQVTNDKRSVIAEYKKLSKHIFPDLKVSYLHGKMKSSVKEETMKKFKDREVDILVSTSVVEVGVDIPNASVMMIEGAESFGLAQLHQFRGRVGRSAHQSYCLLFTDTDSQKAAERLRYFETTDDGFKLAEKDLEMRGPGEVYGTEQSGMMNLRLAKLTDRELIKKAREAAKIVAEDINNYPKLFAKVREWDESVHLE